MEIVKPSPDRPDDRTIAAQLRRPTGELGLKVGEKMNESNRFMTELAYDLLEVQPSDKVLEIGFGDGELLGTLARRLPEGSVTGIDYSEDMVAEAQRRNSDLLSSGRLELVHAALSAIPFSDGSFDKAVTMNTLYFWDSPLTDLIEIRRVLRPGGALVIGIRTRTIMQKFSMFEHGFQLYEFEDVERLLREAGFEEIAKVYKLEPGTEFDALIVRASIYK